MKKFTGVRLNKILVDRNKLSDENVADIERLHRIKHYIFEYMENTDDSEKLKKLANLVELVEYKLQSTWKFNVDKNYHRWFEIPKCTCPKMDNAEYIGTNYKVFNRNCKIHA